MKSGFPGDSDSTESACNAGDPGLIPGLGRSPGGGHGNPFKYSCQENPHEQKSLQGYSPWGHKETQFSNWVATEYTGTVFTGLDHWEQCISSLWVVPVYQPQASSIVHRTWTGDSFHTWYFTCFNAILPNLPNLSHRVHKTVLYISVSFAVSYTGLLLPSF